MTKIMLIEDDTMLAGAIETFLKLNQFEVASADNAEGAIELFDSFVPNLVISDLMLGVSSGFTFLRWIRGRPEYWNIPVLILTARSEQRTLREAMGDGADDYLTKPVTSEDLLAAITSRLARFPGSAVVGAMTQQLQPTGAASAPNSSDIVEKNRWSLTARELEVIHFLISGKDREEIAAVMGISEGTLKRHVNNIRWKLGVNSTIAVAIKVLKSSELLAVVNASASSPPPAGQ